VKLASDASPCNVPWIVRDGRALEPAPFHIMGIVNVTPDSFSDGGRSFSAEAACEHASRLLAEGASIVDVGGESTRPFADEVDEAEELRRVLPVVRGVLERHPGALVSVDTYKARVAEQALLAGAAIVNDVSACAFEPRLLEVVAQHKPGYVLMHSLGRPKTMQVEPLYDDVLAEVHCFFERGLELLTGAGLPEDRIALDPGIGFGKTLEHNLDLLRGLGSFLDLGRPLLVGLSNKSFLGRLLGLEVGQRGPATQVATALAQVAGARIHRVHQVAQAVQALTLTEALRP